MVGQEHAAAISKQTANEDVENDKRSMSLEDSDDDVPPLELEDEPCFGDFTGQTTWHNNVCVEGVVEQKDGAKRRRVSATASSSPDGRP